MNEIAILLTGFHISLMWNLIVGKQIKGVLRWNESQNQVALNLLLACLSDGERNTNSSAQIWANSDLRFPSYSKIQFLCILLFLPIDWYI